MVMQAMHSGRGSKILKRFFFGLLIIAAGGLVLSDVGGFFRGGVGQTDVAIAGKDKISMVEFDRSVRRNLARANIPPAEAYEMGYMDTILGTEIRRSLFQQMAEDYGISIARDLIARQINTMIGPQVQSGQDKQAMLNMLLQQQGFTEAEFVGTVASEVATGLLAKAVQNDNLGASEALAQDLYQYMNETRNAEFIAFLHTDFKETAQPTDEQLESLYNALKEDYAIPEKRDITLGLIEDGQIKSAVTISDEQVRSAYEEDIAKFTIPEERFLEQAVLNTEEEAGAVKTLVEGGKPLKDALKETRGNTEDYLSEQGFQKDGLIPDIADAVFTATDTGNVYGPVESPLGWHVFVLKSIKKSHTKPFDDIKAALKEDMLHNEITGRLHDAANEVDDMLAGGSTLEDVQKTVPMKLIPVPAITALGAMAAENSPLDPFGEDAQQIVKLAFETFEGESSAVSEMADGRLFVVSVDTITAKTYTPLETVKAALREKWLADQKIADNRAFVKELLHTVKTEGTTLKALAEKHGKDVLTAKDLKRREQSQSPITPVALGQIFTAPIHDLVMIDIENGVAIARVTASQYPDVAKADPKELDAIHNAAKQDSGDETISMFYETKAGRIKVKINEALIKRMYGSNENM